MEDKIDRLRFFPEIFLIANTKFDVILGMFFLKLSSTNILFSESILM